MIHGKIVLFKACNPKAYEVLSALKSHVLGEGYLLHIPCLNRFQESLLHHGIGACYLNSHDVLESKGKNRCLHILGKSHLHMN